MLRSLSIKRLLVLLFALASAALFPREAAAQPVIDALGVRNGASYAWPGLPNSAIAQGSIFIVFGHNLGPANIVQVKTFPLPTSQGLAGTSVQVTVAGTTVDAIMLYTLATQVAAVLPSNTPVGTGTLTVTYSGQTSAPAPITVVKSSFGIFTLNQAGSGAGVLQNFNSQSDQPINGSTAPARPGQVIVMWGTGVGPVAGNEAVGALPGNLANVNLHVWVGGKDAAVQYRGRSGCCTGLDEVVFVVPSGVEGCAVPLYVQIDNVISNFATISVAKSGSACSDPGLPASLIQQAAKNGGLRAGSFYVGRVGGEAGQVHSQSDILSAGFTKVPLDLLLLSSPIPKAGQCYVTQFPGSLPASPTYLDAGKVSVTTPVGPYDLPSPIKGVYNLNFIPGVTGVTGVIGDGTQLKAGTYTFTVSGGADVGPVTASIDYPRSFEWNHDAITSVDRSKPLTITWTGGNPGAMVSILGDSAVSLGAGSDIGVAFTCWADATAGSFTVPVSVLSALPASYTDDHGHAHGTLEVVHALYTNTFTASGLDYGSIFYSDTYSKGFMPYQ